MAAGDGAVPGPFRDPRILRAPRGGPAVGARRPNGPDERLPPSGGSRSRGAIQPCRHGTGSRSGTAAAAWDRSSTTASGRPSGNAAWSGRHGEPLGSTRDGDVGPCTGRAPQAGSGSRPLQPRTRRDRGLPPILQRLARKRLPEAEPALLALWGGGDAGPGPSFVHPMARGNAGDPLARRMPLTVPNPCPRDCSSAPSAGKSARLRAVCGTLSAPALPRGAGPLALAPVCAREVKQARRNQFREARCTSAI